MVPITIFALIATSVVIAHPVADQKTMQDAISLLVNEVDSSHLTVNRVLKFNEQLEHVKATQGDRITLRCEVLSTPAAVFEWRHNGAIVQGDLDLNVYEKIMNINKPTVESGVVVSTYTIPCATQASAGTYTCIAYNGHSKIESNAEVVVEGEDSVCKPPRRSAPSIVQWTDSRFEMESNTATLVCRTNKPAAIAWTYDDVIINNKSDRFEVMANGDLVIKSITWDDMGTYVCIASNKIGESRVETFLYPTKKKN